MEEISSGDCKNDISVTIGQEIMNCTHEFFLLTTVLNLDVGLSSLTYDLEGEVLDIRLDFYVVEFATDETLSIEYTDQVEGTTSVTERICEVMEEKPRTCCEGSSRLGSWQRLR